jgi:GxxExxY protein
MPARCEIEIESLSTKAFSELDYVVMSHAFKCQNQFGRLADERIYEANLAARLNDSQMVSLTQVPLQVSHATFCKTYYLDLIVSQKGIYELKAVASLNNGHVAQLLTYLYLLDLPRGKLVNFRSSKIESQFVNAPLSRKARTSFSIANDHYHGSTQLFDMTVNMLLGLGTSLSVSLYQELLVHLLGGESVATAMLPISDGKRLFGNQRFHLVTPSESLRVTCFRHIPSDYENQILSLLKFSPLNVTQWINIDVEMVTFKTVTNN